MRLLSAGSGEVLLTRPHCIFYYNTVPPCLPCIQPLLNPPPYCMGCGDMTGSLQYHLLKDNGPIKVPPSELHPNQLLVQGSNKASPNLPTQRSIVVGWNYCEVAPPPLSCPVVHDNSIEAIDIIVMNPLAIGFLELEVFLGWGVARQTPLLPLPFQCLPQRVLTDPPLCLVGVFAVRGEGGGLRSVPFCLPLGISVSPLPSV